MQEKIGENFFKTTKNIIITVLILFPVLATARFLGYARLNAGISLTKIGRTQTIPWPDWPMLKDDYIDHSSRTTAATFGAHAGVGYQFETIRAELGIGVNTTTDHESKGQIYQLQLYHNFNYRYRSNLTRIMLESRLAYYVCRYLIPYIDGGIGYGMIFSHSFKDTSLIPAQASNPFRDRSSENFVWQIGAGLGFQVAKNTELGLGYEYINMGTASIGPAARSRLKAGKVNAQEVTASISYTI